MAAAAGLGEAVALAGWQPFPLLPDLLAAAPVALALADDNLANRAKCSAKLLELLWLRKAVVADRVGQQAEYIQHEQSGLLSDPDDAQTMAGAAVRLLRDPELARRLGEAGRRNVLTTYAWPLLAQRAEAAYAAALASHTPRRSLRQKAAPVG
jgi:glycosyltransferase involved in cell wall biosynthesis